MCQDHDCACYGGEAYGRIQHLEAELARKDEALMEIETIAETCVEDELTHGKDELSSAYRIFVTIADRAMEARSK